VPDEPQQLALLRRALPLPRTRLCGGRRTGSAIHVALAQREGLAAAQPALETNQQEALDIDAARFQRQASHGSRYQA